MAVGVSLIGILAIVGGVVVGAAILAAVVTMSGRSKDSED